jgi:hypothetical protein
MTMYKRIILLLIFLLTTLGIGYAIYRVFFAGPEQNAPRQSNKKGDQSDPRSFPAIGTTSTNRGGGGGSNTLPNTTGETRSNGTGQTFGRTTPQRTAEPRVKQVTSEIISHTGKANNALTYYNRTDGKFYRIDANGNAIPLSDQTFFNVDTVTWNGKGTSAIIEYPDGANIYYDFGTKRQVTLPKHWEEFSFDKDGSEIAAKSIGTSKENRWLVTAKPDGTNISLIEPMGNNADRVIVNWSPKGNMIGLSRTGEAMGADREEILFVGKNGENFKSTVVEGRGIVPQWSPEGNRLLYSVYSARSDFKPELWIVNASGDSIGTGRTSLHLNTWANKCTFHDERYVYCGVPAQLQTGAGFAPEVADTTPDKLYRIDTHSGTKIEIPLDDNYTIGSINLSEDGSRIFFTDKNKDGIYTVPL